MVNKFELGQNIFEATIKIHNAKDEGVVDYSIETRSLKIFRLGCKDLNYQAKSGVDSEMWS